MSEKRCLPEQIGETLPAGTKLKSYDGYVWTGSDLKKLHNNLKSESLRKKLDIQDDITSSDIRELELRNWVDLQVLGNLSLKKSFNKGRMAK